MQSSKQSVLVPGDDISFSDNKLPGQGVFQRGSNLIASILGIPQVSENVVLTKGLLGKSSYNAIPSVGSVVIARVLSLAGTHVTCEVVMSGNQQMLTPFHAVIRREHIRESEIDKIKMEDMFRPGDLVQAVVASLGDSRSLFLSTVSTNHGVIFARSIDGNVMIHDSPGEMLDRQTGLREKRKNALI
jgi:exosome complex component CSL4